jgi:hypothetical protein
VSFDERGRCRRRTAADATASPLTTAVRTGGQLPEEPVVEWLVRWNSPAHTERCPGGPQYHLTELSERTSLVVSPATNWRRRGPRTVFRGDFDVLAEIQFEFLFETVDDKIKQVVFLYLVVCLCGFHTSSKQTLSLKPDVID